MTPTIHRPSYSVPAAKSHQTQRKWSTHPIFVPCMSQRIRHWHRWMGKCRRLASVRIRRMQRWRHCNHYRRYRRCPINFRTAIRAMRAARFPACQTTAWASVWAWMSIHRTATTNCRRWACHRRTTTHRPQTHWAASAAVRWVWCRRTSKRNICTSRRSTVCRLLVSTFRSLAQWRIRHCRRNLRTAKMDYIRRRRVCRPTDTIPHMAIIEIFWTVSAPVRTIDKHCKATAQRWVHNRCRFIRLVPVAAASRATVETVSTNESE